MQKASTEKSGGPTMTGDDTNRVFITRYSCEGETSDGTGNENERDIDAAVSFGRTGLRLVTHCYTTPRRRK